MATVTLTQENFEQTVSAGGIVLVDFWATWCGPCRQFGPVFEEASEKHPDVVFGKIDTDDQQQLAMAAQITSIPTLMAFRDGIAVFRQSGALPLSALEDLISQIQNLDMDDVRAKITRPTRLSDRVPADVDGPEVRTLGPILTCCYRRSWKGNQSADDANDHRISFLPASPPVFPGGISICRLSPLRRRTVGVRRSPGGG